MHTHSPPVSFFRGELLVSGKCLEAKKDRPIVMASLQACAADPKKKDHFEFSLADGKMGEICLSNRKCFQFGLSKIET